MNVICYKLITGEEIIARIVNEEENLVILSHILQVQLTRGQDGNPAAMLAPWLFLQGDYQEVIVPKTAVLAAWSPPQEVEKNYLRQTSGIHLG